MPTPASASALARSRTLALPAARRFRLGDPDLAGAFERPAVAVGVFDGVHRGHQEVIRRLRERAGDRASVVVTFDEHPRQVLTGSGPPLLTSLEHRVLLLGRSGIDGVVVLPFREVMTWGADRFVDEFLVGTLGVSWVMVGEDHRFGKDREGDLALLEKRGEAGGFQAEGIALERVAGGSISSTVIREAVAKGDVATASDLLGRPLSVLGRVIQGEQRGRTIGFPTANLGLAPGVAAPARGVYVAEARVVESATGIEEAPLPAVVNVGRRPTFGDDDPDLIEAHLLRGGRDLYGLELELSFLARIRDEQKFSGVEALKAQIGRDVAAAREILGAE
ncbi:MAG: bifunctional riboflavin kinase/FAD synthetase [Planctomycetes bacterium]|nr:bifunctional riboflavin kinase/FAD synthetase [Planctomycetota bacterium]